MKNNTKYENISGQKFNKLTALYKLNNYHKKGCYWLCVCDCGNLKEVRKQDLKRGYVKSCGCSKKGIHTTHEKTNTRLYKIYYGMRRRCYNVNYPYYKDYGGRGITMCDEWFNNFMNFHNWAIDNGYDDNLTIDRIDNNKGYSPNNCRWTTSKQQNRNRRTAKLITYKGETKPLAEWCEILNLNYWTIKSRLYRGWDIEKAIELNIKEVKLNV